MLPDITYEYGTCRSKKCGARILWVKLENAGRSASGGRSAPLDAEPTSTGNVELLGDGRARVMGKREVEESTSDERFVSHLATCPDRAEFRGKDRQS